MRGAKRSQCGDPTSYPVQAHPIRRELKLCVHCFQQGSFRRTEVRREKDAAYLEENPKVVRRLRNLGKDYCEGCGKPTTFYPNSKKAWVRERSKLRLCFMCFGIKNLEKNITR